MFDMYGAGRERRHGEPHSLMHGETQSDKKLMHRLDIRTALNIYDDLVTDEMAQAHLKG